MKNWYILLLLAFVSACATVTPADLRKNGTKHQFVMAQPPSKAAGCVVRNAENAGDVWWGHVVPTVRDGETPGTVEVVALGMFAAEFAPNGTGSTATVYMAPQVLEFLRQRYLRAFHGC